MLAQQRHTIILELLDKNGTVHTSDLVKTLKVSSETIRKDLDFLEQEGRLARVHGGAVPARVQTEASQKLPEASPEKPADIPSEYISFQTRNSQHMDQKAAITEYAASLVREHQVVALDYGSTSQMMAMTLKKHFRHLTVITNSIQNALILAECPGFTIILLGGILSKEEYTLSNDFAPMLDMLHIDLLFMTVTGIDSIIGFTDQRLEEAKVQNQMRKSASQTIVLADSSKFGKRSLVKIGSLQEVDAIITDSGLSPDMEKAVRETGTRLIMVPEEKEP